MENVASADRNGCDGPVKILAWSFAEVDVTPVAHQGTALGPSVGSKSDALDVLRLEIGRRVSSGEDQDRRADTNHGKCDNAGQGRYGLSPNDPWGDSRFSFRGHYWRERCLWRRVVLGLGNVSNEPPAASRSVRKVLVGGITLSENPADSRDLLVDVIVDYK
jgi:hypothetical protein